MLSGGYSKNYQTMEKSQVQTLKDLAEIDQSDSIARARRLSQETNKRRKQQILKRKMEVRREEKRRNDILAKRRDEQRKATEKFQRANIPTSRPGSRKNSPQRANIDEALRLIRGTTSLYSRQTSSSGKTGRTSPRAFSSNNYHHEAANRIFSDGDHYRPRSAKDHVNNLANEHALMMNRSFRNMTTSRNLFETQLEHHQQLLVEDQKKALHQFNEAIMNEIEGDQRVQGFMDIDAEIAHSDSLSSLDSLDDQDYREKPADVHHGSPSCDAVASDDLEQPSHSAPVFTVAPTSLSYMGGGEENKPLFVMTDKPNRAAGQQQDPRVQSQSRKLEEVMQYRNCGDIESPSSLNSSSSFLSNLLNSEAALSNGLAHPNSSQKSQQSYVPGGNVNSQSSTQSGGNFRPQTSSQSAGNVRPQSSIQPGGRVIPQMSTTTPSSLQHTAHYVSNGLDAVSQGTVNTVPSGAVTQDRIPGQFVLAQNHSPLVSDQFGKMNKLFSDTPVSTTSHYSSILAAHNSPSTSTTTYLIGPRQLASKTTHQTREWITSESPSTSKELQTWQGQNGQLPTEQFQIRQSCLPPNTGVNLSCDNTVLTSHLLNNTTNLTSFTVAPSVSSHCVTMPSYTRHDNSYSTMTPQVVPKSLNTNPQSSTVNCKTVALSVTSDVSTYSVAAMSKKPVVSEQAIGSKVTFVGNRNLPVTRDEAMSVTTEKHGGSISDGTLGLVNGKLTVLMTGDSSKTTEAVTRVSNKPPRPSAMRETSSDNETGIRSILKKPHLSVMKKADSTGNLNVKDSIEVARQHLKQHSLDQLDSLPKKKSVRFSDLDRNCNKMISTGDGGLETEKKELNIRFLGSTKGTPKPKPRTKVISAKGSNPSKPDVQNRTTRPTSTGTLQPRVHQADIQQHAKDRPRAAAHIITHSIEGAQFLQEINSNSRSDQHKKIRVVNNNFMEKVPVQQKAAISQHAGYRVPEWYDSEQGMEGTAAEKTDENGSNLKYTGAPAVSVKHPPAMYNENGMRIDRTPTDEEINSLWDTVRTCLDSTPTSSDRLSQMEGSVETNGSKYTPSLSNKYMDGASLGLTSNTRVASAGSHSAGYNLNHGGVQHRAMNNMSNGKPRTTANGYLRRYALLHQRRPGSERPPLAPHQNSVHSAPVVSHQGPQAGTSYQTKEDVSESLKTFMVAENLDELTSESPVDLGFDERHRRRVLQVKQQSPTGPSALSLEEQRLLESLDRLNEKLKINDTGYPVRSTPQQVAPSQQNMFVHYNSQRFGFRPF
ncbi:uncharacterized protein LOC121372600 isoform X2 [Gigantopelta aegis]|uniref:uncharacterized protein LOC121372600 isoform X2 n=1 Tax=Gigantopelta aegis TaxID=1735272 RepID=UPI001B887975|nr:uncharacterized protein LOC121372600 isoform X2 [Gigantopelta aegis]